VRKSRLDDRKLRELEARIAELSRKRAHVGILQAEGSEPKRGPDGKAAKLSLVEIAVTHELGSPAAGIPERSFIGRTMDDHREEFGALATQLARGVILEKLTPDQALGLLGMAAATEVKNTITQGESIPPPLSEATLEKRARRRTLNHTFAGDRALADTGQLVNAITSAVVARGEED
jgi:hypothetical protein